MFNCKCPATRFSDPYELFPLAGDAPVIVCVEHQDSVAGLQGPLDVRQLSSLLQTVIDYQPARTGNTDSMVTLHTFRREYTNISRGRSFEILAQTQSTTLAAFHWKLDGEMESRTHCVAPSVRAHGQSDKKHCFSAPHSSVTLPGDWR